MTDRERPQPRGLVPLRAGDIAAVVTHLEMRERPARRSAAPPPGNWNLAPIPSPSTDRYRELYRRVGADWLWFSRLELGEAELAAIIRNPAVDIFEAVCDGESAGLLELDRRTPGEVELAFFGLAQPFLGMGAGRWLMEHALDLAWQNGVNRVWVHTCTLDHPHALPFYIRCGFVPYRREIETVPDPRLRGVLPRSAAAQHPVIC